MKILIRFAEGAKADPGERWITVHPHGDDQKGQPVLVRVNPSNPRQGHIIGGAGGSLNLRRVNLKTPTEYKTQAAESRRQRRELSREERAAGREGAHREIQKQHAQHRREALTEILRLGGHSGDVTAPAEQTEGLDPAAAFFESVAPITSRSFETASSRSRQAAEIGSSVVNFTKAQ